MKDKKKKNLGKFIAFWVYPKFSANQKKKLSFAGTRDAFSFGLKI